MDGITNQVSGQTEPRLSSCRGPIFHLFSQCLWWYLGQNKHFSSISWINWTKEQSAKGRSRSNILKNLRDYMKAIKNESSGNFFQSQYSFSVGALSWHIFFSLSYSAHLLAKIYELQKPQLDVICHQNCQVWFHFLFVQYLWAGHSVTDSARCSKIVADFSNFTHSTGVFP